MNDPVTLLRARVGRRGVVLLVLAAVWLLFGLSIATYTPPPGTSGRFGMALLDSPWWAIVWLAAGVTSGWYVIRRAWAAADAAGWAAAIFPPIVWTGLYAVSWLWRIATDGAIGSDRAWVGVVSWLLVVVLVRTIAGWEDFHDRPLADEESR